MVENKKTPPLFNHSLKQRHRSSTALLMSGILVTSFAAITAPSFAQSSDPLPDVESTIEGAQVPTEARFACQISNGEYTVMYLPENQPESAYAWATPGDMGGGWTAEKRCFTISERLESYRPEGLAELQVGSENGYDTVCATTEQFPSLCKIVFTVPPGQNPVITRDLVFENLALADGGTDTTVVSTFTGSSNSGLLGEIGSVINSFPMPNTPTATSSSNSINLKPFLSPADGGTGTALGELTPAGRRLNPDNFR